MKKGLVALFLISSTLLSSASDKESFGVEVNPLRVLLSMGSWKSFSGTVSHFDNEHGVEIAFPIYYSKENFDRFNGYETSEIVANMDLRYRMYSSDSITDGSYMGVFGRYTYLDGQAKKSSKLATVQKFGIGGEVGFRSKRLFNMPLYWGMSLALGAYVVGENDVLDSSGLLSALEDTPVIIDIELLKVGYEF